MVETMTTSTARGNALWSSNLKIVSLLEAPHHGVEQSFAASTGSDQEVRRRKGYTVVDYEALPTTSLKNLGSDTLGLETEASAVLGRRVAGGRRKRAPVVAERFWLLNRWRGQVLSIDADKDTFEAELFDPMQPLVVERAQFAVSELPPDAAPLLRPGAAFYWMIGYRDSGSRQRKRESVIWMRRSGRMGADKFKTSLEEVNKIWGALEKSAEPAATNR